MTKEELQNQINTLKPRQEELYKIYKEKAKEIQEEMVRLFQDITKESHTITIHLSSYATNITIKLERRYMTLTYDYEKPIIEASICGNGAFTVENKEEIELHRMLVNFFDNYEKYTTPIYYIKSKIAPLLSEIDKICWDIGYAKAQINDIERIEEIERVMNSIKVGNIYNVTKNCSRQRKNETFDSWSEMKVKNITDKNIIVSLKHGQLTWEQSLMYYGTKRYSKNDFAAWIKNNIIEEVQE